MSENENSLNEQNSIVPHVEKTEKPKLIEQFEEKAIRRKSNKPMTDNDILAVLESLIPKWNESKITVAWMLKSELEQLFTDYKSVSFNRRTSGASRGGTTDEIGLLDKEIDVAIEHVKNRLSERLKSKRSAIARYPELGIEKGRKYALPEKREDRLKAFPILIESLKAYNFLDTEFNLKYWEEVYVRYETLAKQARSTAGNVSMKVGTLNQYRAETRKFFNSFISIIRGNFPDTWRNELRNYGFQKEKY